MKEGTSFFTVKALLPVVESFGFADGERVIVPVKYMSRLLTPHVQIFERKHLVQPVHSLFSAGESILV